MRPSREEAEEAIRVLLRWAGEDPERGGLRDTPARVARSYEELCRGYDEDPPKHLERTFDDVDGYDEVVLLRGIEFESMCEHHMAAIIGRVSVAYLPTSRVVGISKIARVVDGYAKRLQVQERMTRQIAEALDKALSPRAVAVIVEAEHQCMSTRGVHKRGVETVTSCMLGLFREDASARAEVMSLILGPTSR